MPALLNDSVVEVVFFEQDNIINHKERTAQKIKLSIKDFFRKCDQIRRKLRIWPPLLKKFLMENFIFCAVKLINIWLRSDHFLWTRLMVLECYTKFFFLHSFYSAGYWKSSALFLTLMSVFPSLLHLTLTFSP